MKIVTLILVAVVMWLAGLLAFSGRVQRSTPAPMPPHADGIVVLTGGSSLRLVEAMRLLEKGEARRLLVSGVNPEASRTDIMTVSKAVRPLYECCVDLGFQAANTVGNARETAAWARAKDYRSLIVVTADFHMPRAMIEIHAALPEAQLRPYPVATGTLNARAWWRSQEGARRMVLEYNKYLAVFARDAAIRLIGKGAPRQAAQSPNPAG
ncbi:MAG: hypothetical protein JWM33_892 [Caulobacteraceae bacterium]|nr:hypothetical protein [Caulobacteraceae bacterium]